MSRKLEILAAMGSSEPGTQYVRLTPSQPRVAGKGAFVFVAPEVVEGGQGYVRFTESSFSWTGPSRAVLWLYSTQGRNYLIDCAISGESYIGIGSKAGPILAVTGPGNATQVFDFSSSPADSAGYHLLFGLEVQETGWYPFTITSGANQPGTGVLWKLHACEVTNL